MNTPTISGRQASQFVSLLLVFDGSLYDCGSRRPKGQNCRYPPQRLGFLEVAGDAIRSLDIAH